METEEASAPQLGDEIAVIIKRFGGKREDFNWKVQKHWHGWWTERNGRRRIYLLGCVPNMILYWLQLRSV